MRHVVAIVCLAAASWVLGGEPGAPNPAPAAAAPVQAAAPPAAPAADAPTAGSAAQVPPTVVGGLTKWITDNPFTATLTLVVLITLVGTIISRRMLDRCLKDFAGYPAVLELKDGRLYFGQLEVQKSGMELFYERTIPQGDITRTSFLIYQPEYGVVHALVRYHDSLSEAQVLARLRAAQRAYHPNFFRRTARATRNLIVSLKDAVIEALNIALGRMKGIQAVAPVMQTGGAYVTKVGTQTIGTAADIAYDPLLERQIGLRVVLELPKDASAQDECVGTFREYTKDFFELMDVDYKAQWTLTLPTAGSAAAAQGVAALRLPTGLQIENHSIAQVELIAIAKPAPPVPPDDSLVPAEPLTPPVALPATLSPGEKLEFPFPAEAGEVSLTFTTCRRADLIVPRTGAFIRHKNEWAPPRETVGQMKRVIRRLGGRTRVARALRRGAELVTRTRQKNVLPFVKMHGCGNDYIYVDCREREVERPEELARRLSDRHFGIGSDGLILILPSQEADYRMRMFNSDGSEAEMCGNGIRGFAKYLYDRGLVSGDELSVETKAGVLRVHVFAERHKARRLRVNMGRPRLDRSEIPMSDPPGRAIDEELTIDVPGEGKIPLRFTAVSMGNPHCVIFVDDTDRYPVARYGPLVETHALFPRRTNVEFVQIVSRAEVKMRVWERGAGETLACGTGASAVAVAGVLTGKTDSRITVHLLGGNLDIEVADDGCVHLTGPAEEVFEGTLKL